MHTQDFVNALTSSLPFIPFTVIFWFSSTDTLLRAIAVIPPILAIIQSLTKSRPGAKISDLQVVDFKENEYAGHQVSAKLTCTGRSVLSNVTIKLDVKPAILQKFIQIMDDGISRDLLTQNSQSLNEFTINQLTRLRKGDKVSIIYPRGLQKKDSGGSNLSGQTRFFLDYYFFNLEQGQEYDIHLTIQGDDPKGETYELTKEIKYTPRPVQGHVSR